MSTDIERNLSKRQKEERMSQAEFEQYAKEHGYIISTTNIIEQIRAEIAEYKDDKVIHAERNEMIDIVLEILDKYR